MTAERRKSALESASDGVELPLAVMSVQLSNHDCRLNREILAEIITNQLGVRRLIDNADKRVGNLSKILDRKSVV